MLENLEPNKNKSELVEKANSLKPQFKSNAEAVIFYSHALEKICSKYGKSTEEFLLLAENQAEYNDEFMEALSLARAILTLKS